MTIASRIRISAEQTRQLILKLESLKEAKDEFIVFIRDIIVDLNEEIRKTENELNIANESLRFWLERQRVTGETPEN